MSRAPRNASLRRDWGDDDSQTPILHVDMDAFFVAVELLDKPQLRGKPIAVGGRDRGVISAASYEARQFGVNSAMPVAMAKRRCPELIILPVNMEHYRRVSADIMRILNDITPHVEQISVDEAFLDVRGARRLFGSPREIGELIRRRIHGEVGVAASVGIASTKHLAKIASAHAKPDGLLLIPHHRSLEFLHSLPVGALWGVGEKTRAKLESRGVEKVIDVVRLGEKRMVNMLGQAAGTRLYALAMNKDAREVSGESVDKSISKEQTFFEQLHDQHEVLRVMLEQSYSVARRLRAHHLLARTISIKVRSGDFVTLNRSHKLGTATDVGAEIFDIAKMLFTKLDMPVSGVRLVGVRAEQFVLANEGIQIALDDDGRRAQAEDAMDAVHEKYGDAVLVPASLIDNLRRKNTESS
ncbi:DNA polymerase IV [Arcanobacterium bovis]|uniref:DNA polymerase IV n=2 Tax=Arcanobacterium bovis TaxID=2529275 RepID=A0A4V6MYT7_9ACTO|nr:DNA polymerase IV [Arcanobacterium bovis]TBW23029.1 DNA polymerase IV [Arcanobacterium bovis]